MDALIAFLTARLDEEQIAATMFAGDPDWSPETLAVLWGSRANDPLIRHAAYYDPARVLRELKAKRAIIAEHMMAMPLRYAFDSPRCDVCLSDRGRYPEDWHADLWPCRTLRILAETWADHPDFKRDWAFD